MPRRPTRVRVSQEGCYAVERFAVFLLLAASVLIVPAAAQDEVTLQLVGDNFWVACDNLPNGDISPQLLQRLMTFLTEHVQPDPASPLGRWLNHTPVVIEFVPDDMQGLFPYSTQGFAGLSGLASWTCDSITLDAEQPLLLHCRFATATDETDSHRLIRLALIHVPADSKEELLGYSIHELTHLLGSVDGPRCPAHADYNPMIRRPDDRSDAYWWFGMSGVFELKPAGIVWLALNNACDRCGAVDICEELSQILADVDD